MPKQINYLAHVDDTNSPSLTIMETTVTLPKVPIDHAYIGVTYFGAGAGITFFQCADVRIL